MVLHWGLSDSKSPQVSRTRLRILAVFSNAVVWIVSTRPPISKSSRPFNNPLVIVPNAPITIGTIVTFMFHSFFNSLARSRFLSFFSLSFRIILWSAGTAKSTILQLMVFHWSFNDSKSPQVPRTFLSILANLNNIVVLIVSTNPLISKSPSPFNNPLVTVPKAPMTTSLSCSTVFFFYSLARSSYSSFFSFSFNFTLWSAGTAKSTMLRVLFLFI